MRARRRRSRRRGSRGIRSSEGEEGGWDGMFGWLVSGVYVNKMCIFRLHSHGMGMVLARHSITAQT